MSADLISLQDHRDALLDQRWNEYIISHRRAQETLSMEDGKAAGAAWRAWLDLWMTEEQRQWVGYRNSGGAKA